jgi:hypothetical protein
LAVAAGAAALTMWIATSPRFLHPINPVAPSMFPICAYVALAALAAFAVPASRGLRAIVWLPAIAHFVLIAFAAYSFLRRGHWPWNSFPDPKELHVPFFYCVAVLAVLGGAMAIPMGAIALIVTVFDIWARDWREKIFILLHSTAVLAFGAWLWIFECHDKRLIGWLAD